VKRGLLAAALGTVLWGRAAVAQTPSVIKGPYLQHGGSRAVTIVWESDSPSSAEVRVCLVGAACQVITEDTAALHEVRVPDLVPGSRYQYTVRSYFATLGPYEFGTAPEGPGEPFTFLVYGDNRNDVGGAHQALVEAMHLESPDFILQTGDLVATGGDEADWSSFFDIERELLHQHVLWPALGNHELAGGGLPVYRKYFDVPQNSPDPERYYSFRHAGSLFVSLDGNQPASELQRAWLEHELVSARKDKTVEHIFVQVHQPVYSTGAHGGSVDMQGLWAPLFEQAGVTAVFQGHDHLYERLRKGHVTYFVSGGGGGPLYAQKADALDMPVSVLLESAHHFLRVRVLDDTAEVAAIRLDGTEIERVLLQHTSGAYGVELPTLDQPLGRSTGAPTTTVACSVTVGARTGSATATWIVLFTVAGASARARGRRRESASARPPSCRAR
jgi:3',5'-cyclic AMP phosphodiesterase CpdA